MPISSSQAVVGLGGGAAIDVGASARGVRGEGTACIRFPAGGAAKDAGAAVRDDDASRVALTGRSTSLEADRVYSRSLSLPLSPSDRLCTIVSSVSRALEIAVVLGGEFEALDSPAFDVTSVPDDNFLAPIVCGTVAIGRPGPPLLLPLLPLLLGFFIECELLEIPPGLKVRAEFGTIVFPRGFRSLLPPELLPESLPLSLPSLLAPLLCFATTCCTLKPGRELLLLSLSASVL